MFWDVVGWVVLVYAAGMGFAAVQEAYARGKRILDQVRERHHQREMEMIEKQIELARLLGKETPAADGEGAGQAGTGGLQSQAPDSNA